jgi:hypothetical protein
MADIALCRYCTRDTPLAQFLKMLDGFEEPWEVVIRLDRQTENHSMVYNERTRVKNYLMCGVRVSRRFPHHGETPLFYFSYHLNIVKVR